MTSPRFGLGRLQTCWRRSATPLPADELEAKFSIPFCMGILLLERAGGIAQFTDEVVLRPDVQEMMARVKPYLHEDLEALGFQRIRSLIEVHLRDGTVLSTEALTSRGTPERPMSVEELAGKFGDCAQGLLAEDVTSQGDRYDLPSRRGGQRERPHRAVERIKPAGLCSWLLDSARRYRPKYSCSAHWHPCSARCWSCRPSRFWASIRSPEGQLLLNALALGGVCLAALPPSALLGRRGWKASRAGRTLSRLQFASPWLQWGFG